MANTTTKSEVAAEEAALFPTVDVIEDTTGITLYADMPGVAKEKLQLHVDADTLTIAGEMHLSFPEGMESSHVEVRVPRFRRAFTLSKELDTDKIGAEFDKGVLKLRIPKVAHAQPRKVEIQVG
jgi:HSP20 family molecular chaperone IbpA